MDIWYIVLNSLMYGLVSFMLMWFFAYYKFLNFSIWVILVFSSYLISHFYLNGFTSTGVVLLLWFVVFYFLINFLVLKFFKNIKQRELFWLVFTLWSSILLENWVNYIFWPTSVSINNIVLWTPALIILFVLLNVFLIYFFKYSFTGKIFKWIQENGKILRSLWYKLHRKLYHFAWLLLLTWFLSGFLILVFWNIRSSDHIFYLFKGIGIMILVGITKIEYVFVWALLYVLLEYVLFISLWFPIAYKETLILIVILVLLVFKPQWIFTFKSRKF